MGIGARGEGGGGGADRYLLIPFLSCGLSISLVNFPIQHSSIYLCSKLEVYGSPMNVSDGCLVYTWSDNGLP